MRILKKKNEIPKNEKKDILNQIRNIVYDLGCSFTFTYKKHVKRNEFLQEKKFENKKINGSVNKKISFITEKENRYKTSENLQKNKNEYDLIMRNIEINIVIDNNSNDDKDGIDYKMSIIEENETNLEMGSEIIIKNKSLGIAEEEIKHENNVHLLIKQGNYYFFY